MDPNNKKPGRGRSKDKKDNVNKKEDKSFIGKLKKGMKKSGTSGEKRKTVKSTNKGRGAKPSRDRSSVKGGRGNSRNSAKSSNPKTSPSRASSKAQGAPSQWELQEQEEMTVLEDRAGFEWTKLAKVFHFAKKKVENFDQVEGLIKKAEQMMGITYGYPPKINELKSTTQALAKSNSLRGVSIRQLEHEQDGRESEEVFDVLVDQNPSLVVLNLAGIKLKKNAVKALTRSIRNNSILQSLNLSRCELRDSGCKVLCAALKTSSQSKICDLNLTSNKLTTDIAVEVADLISSPLCKLEILLLDRNKFQTTGALTLAYALEVNTSLLVFSLESNDVYSKVVTALHDVILNNDVIQIISLKDNAIDDVGVEKMINSIRVKKIMLSTNYFRENPDKLKSFTTRDFHSTEKSPSEEDDDEIGSIVKEFNKSTLWKLNLEKNNISDTNARDLEYVLKAKLMTVFRYHRDDKVYWSREAWTLAETEFGPKFIEESINALSRRDTKRVKYIVNVRNKQDQRMVEVLLRNKYINVEVFNTVKLLSELGELNLDEQDSLGRTFRDVMRHHENSLIRKWAKSQGALDGKYMLETVPPIHESNSAEVLLGKHVDTNESLVIKIFKRREDWERERDVREALTLRGWSGISTTAPEAIKAPDTVMKKDLLIQMQLQRARGQKANRRQRFSKANKEERVGRDRRAGSKDRRVGSKDQSKQASADPSLAGLGVSLREYKPADDHLEYVVKAIDKSRKGSKYNYFVYEKADKSLFQIMNSERIAGLNLKRIKKISKQAAECLQYVNACGYTHGDFKPRSLLRSSYASDDYKLIDFDGSVKHGEPVLDKFSSAYIPPELAKAKFVYEKKFKVAPDSLTEEEKAGMTVLASEKFDVWSFGVVMYELLSGSELFESLKHNDNISTADSKAELVNWLEVSEDILQKVLELREEQENTKEVANAREIVRWCLQCDPDKRPTFSQLLKHPFLAGVYAYSPDLVTLSKNFRTHLFLSHIQSQAAGTVKDVYYAAKELGCSAWLDMKAGSITQQAMYEGVKMTQAFVICLTKDTLFSYFCLKELMWALDFGKKIIILEEVDQRQLLSPFNKDHFMKRFNSEDELNRISNGLGELESLMLSNVLMKAVEDNQAEISSSYAGNAVKWLLQKLVLPTILSLLSSEDCLPYRRREYENSAMMDYLLYQVGFVPPSDPIFNETFALHEGDGLNQDLKVMLKLTDAPQEDRSKRNRARFGNQRQNKQLRRQQHRVQNRRNQRQRNVPRNAGAFSSKDDIRTLPPEFTLKNCNVIVLIGKDSATEMCTVVRQGIQQYLQLDSYASQWHEFGPEEEISSQQLESFLSNNKKVAILCVMTANYFMETNHGRNLLALEQAVRAQMTEFPVVMVQDDWFGRPWTEIQAEVGSDYNHYLLDVEFMPYRSNDQRLYEHDAMLQEVSERIIDFCE